MKIQCLQENLTKGLAIVSRAVASRNTTLPVLSNIMISTDDGRLKLSATNLEMGINCWIGGKVELGGAITLPASTFVGLITAMPKEVISMELNVRTQTLELKCGRSEANIKGLDAQEFPLIPMPDSEEKILIEPDVLSKMIQQVAFAAATDESRLMLTGVLTKFDHDQFSMAAADGFRVSVRSTTLDTPAPGSRQAIIPARALLELGRIMSGQKDPVEISFTPSRNQVIFRLENANLVAQLLDVQFPDYEAIVPQAHATKITLDVADFRRICRAAKVFAQDAADTIYLSATHGENGTMGELEVTARSDETGNSAGSFKVDIVGDTTKVALNIRYLQDVLKVMDEVMIIEIVTARHPLVFKSAGDDEFFHVIMPMQMGK